MEKDGNKVRGREEEGDWSTLPGERAGREGKVVIENEEDGIANN